LESFVERFADIACRVTHNLDVSSTIRMTLRDYAAYVDQQHDETPLYIFDPRFGELMPALLTEYHVPPVFAQDFWACLSATHPPHPQKRPDFRWLVVGPAR
jgi:hypothetical protein